MTNTIDKIKPLPLYLRNHTEPHDRGITYRFYGIMGVDCVSILKRIGLGRQAQSQCVKEFLRTRLS